MLCNQIVESPLNFPTVHCGHVCDILILITRLRACLPHFEHDLNTEAQKIWVKLDQVCVCPMQNTVQRQFCRQIKILWPIWHYLVWQSLNSFWPGAYTYSGGQQDLQRYKTLNIYLKCCFMGFSSISISLLEIFRIISLVFNLKYLSENSINFNMLGVF